MPKPVTWLRRAAVAATAAASLSLPMLSVAQADQPAQQTQAVKVHPKNHAATTQWRQPKTAPRPLYGSAPTAPTASNFGCTWPYQNQFPPCMSTFPAGSPHYHGTRPGPTFDDEQ